jgi:peptide/nickel transport system substrate-binding protein
MKRNLNRRDFMKAAGLTGLGIAAVACAPAAPTAAPTAVVEPTATTPAIVVKEATPTTAPTVEASKYKQSPMLDSMGLPPVEERISANPLVTAPREAVGKYGGTLRCLTWWPEAGNIQLYISEPPIKWKEDLTGYEPALAEAYEWSDDGMTFTLHMRKGVKWSDGEPYTSADWKFWWEDMAANEDYKSVSVPSYMRKADGTPIELTYPDEYTVVWKSDQAMWIAPYFMAQGYWEFMGPSAKMKPAHFLKKYHPKYDSTKTYDDLTTIDKWQQTPGYPSVMSYYCSEVAQDGKSYKWARNPYYWRVDTEGNQLPYIDYYNIEIVADEQTRILALTSGKYDISFRDGGSPNDIPLFEEKAADGGYRMLKGWMNGAGAWPGYMVNDYYVEGGKYYTDDTPEHAKEIRDLLRDKRFRKALSWGVDRQRVIDVAWSGIGTPKQATISPQSWHFSSPEGQDVYKKWAAADASLDIEGANKALDEIGMKVGADGFRQLPSGKPFSLVMIVSDWGGSLKVQTDAAAESKTQWETNLKVKVEIQNLQGQPNLDTLTNEGQYMIRGCHVSEIDIMTYPDWIFPIVNRYYMPLEGRYFAKGKDTCKADAKIPNDCGVKPEAGSPAEKLQALYVKAAATKNIEDRHKIVWEAIQIDIDEGPFIIGISGDQQMPIIANTKLKNILDYGVVGPWAPDTPGNQVLAQWFFDV